jgi:hypothetical protein
LFNSLKSLPHLLPRQAFSFSIQARDAGVKADCPVPPALDFETIVDTQITGWGGKRSARDRSSGSGRIRSLSPRDFSGTLVVFVAMGVAAPWAGQAFRRFGPRQVMAAVAGLIGLSLCLLSPVPNLLIFWLGWTLTGLAGAMFLTTSAYRGVHRRPGAQPHRNTYVNDRARWQRLLAYHRLSRPSGQLAWNCASPCRRHGVDRLPTGEFLPTHDRNRNRFGHSSSTQTRRGCFRLLVTAIALNSFVTFRLEAVGIELLRTMARFYR